MKKPKTFPTVNPSRNLTPLVCFRPSSERGVVLSSRRAPQNRKIEHQVFEKSPQEKKRKQNRTEKEEQENS